MRRVLALLLPVLLGLLAAPLGAQRAQDPAIQGWRDCVRNHIPASSRIVFTRAVAPGVEEVFQVRCDGTRLRQLTHLGSLTRHPALSKDGKLAFVTYKGGPPELWGNLEPDGAFRPLLPRDRWAGMELSDLAWSPDGRSLAFIAANARGCTDLFVLDTASGGVRRLTDGCHVNRAPSWSPGGKRLAFVSDREGTPQVFLVGLEGGAPRCLTRDASPKERAAWSPVDDEVAYTARTRDASRIQVCSTLGGEPRLVAETRDPVEGVAWAPNGRWILCSTKAHGEVQLRLHDLEGRVRALLGRVFPCQFSQWVSVIRTTFRKEPAAFSAAHPGLPAVGPTPFP